MSPTLIDWIHAIAAGIAIVWAFFSWIVWDRVRSQREALRVCHDAMRNYEDRLRHIQNVATIQGAELDRTTAQLTAALSGDCEGAP